MEKQKLIFFTGAGISVGSGIPTFQEQPGIRDKLTRDFVQKHPDEYKKLIQDMVNTCSHAKPNDAHKAIAELDYPVITMNVDRLHTLAGSKNVLEIHGILPTIKQLNSPDFIEKYKDLVLYGDIAPKYEAAIQLVKALDYGHSYFVVIGASFYTGISEILLKLAKQRKANIIIVQDDACIKVPHICENLKYRLTR